MPLPQQHPGQNPRSTAPSHLEGAKFDLSSSQLPSRPLGWASADPAGLPITPALIRTAEVKAGVINHAIRFTFPVRCDPGGPAGLRAGRWTPLWTPLGLGGRSVLKRRCPHALTVPAAPLPPPPLPRSQNAYSFPASHIGEQQSSELSGLGDKRLGHQSRFAYS